MPLAVDASSYSMCTDQQLVHAAIPIKKRTSGKLQLCSKQSSMPHYQITSWLLMAVLNKTHVLCCCARLAKERRKRKNYRSVFNCLRVATLKWLLHIAILLLLTEASFISCSVYFQMLVPQQWYHCENSNTVIGAIFLFRAILTHGLRYGKPTIWHNHVWEMCHLTTKFF